jgi:hypothetical protein
VLRHQDGVPHVARPRRHVLREDEAGPHRPVVAAVQQLRGDRRVLRVLPPAGGLSQPLEHVPHPHHAVFQPQPARMSSWSELR